MGKNKQVINMINYNPYNWKIDKKRDIVKSKPQLIYNCVLNELGYVCTELDIIRLRHANLKKELEEVEREMIRLEDEKLSLIKQLAEHP